MVEVKGPFPKLTYVPNMKHRHNLNKEIYLLTCTDLYTST
jgi:hypothetical protein